ncbi:MAG: hypothetical protein FWD94_01195 [Treponema sp.]|nr:hypothetical protein [Treponema sp.]
MINEAKSLLEGVIKRAAPAATVVRSAAEESRAVMARKFPLVALITNPGTFDNGEARTVRFRDGGGAYRERYVRGKRSLPVLVRCWEAGEDKADALLDAVIPELPSRWEHDGFTCEVGIDGEEHSDHAGNLTKGYVSVVGVTFTAYAARKADAVPYIERTEPQGGEYAKQPHA